MTNPSIPHREAYHKSFSTLRIILDEVAYKYALDVEQIIAPIYRRTGIPAWKQHGCRSEFHYRTTIGLVKSAARDALREYYYRSLNETDCKPYAIAKVVGRIHAGTAGSVVQRAAASHSRRNNLPLPRS